MTEYLARVAKVQAEIVAKREAEISSKFADEAPIIFDDSPTGEPTPPEVLPPAVAIQPANSPSAVWQAAPPRVGGAEAPRSPEYQFDLANAAIVCAVLAVAGLVWFARRRLMWLARNASSRMAQFIRWLHMPPDDKI